MSERRALAFDCDGARLIAVAELPASPRETGLLIVTGGPQYRAGSHRQFALLSRAVAAASHAAMTFDFRGSGDSEGAPVSFEQLAPDIRCAIDALLSAAPQVRRVVVLGLCDAASAALMYAPSDPRVAGLVLLNPWVRVAGSLETARLKAYYPSKLASASFWRRLLRGEVRILDSLRSLREQAAAARRDNDAPGAGSGFRSRMLAAAADLGGPIRVVLAGRDMTAREYLDLLRESEPWRRQMSTGLVSHHEIPEATHTFPRAAWRDEVARECIAFLGRVDARPAALPAAGG